MGRVFGLSGRLNGPRARTPTPRGSTGVMTRLRDALLGASCLAGPTLLSCLRPDPHVVSLPGHALL